LIATKLVRITGTVIDSQGAPVTSGALMLVPADSVRGPMMLAGGAARLDRTGGFRITDVAPGRYVLQTRTNIGRRAAGAADGEFARLDLAVGAQDLDGIVLVTAPGARVTGQIVTDSAQAATLRPDELQISARSARPDQMGFAGPGAVARVAADATFTIAGLFDPALFRVGGAPGWSIKQVLFNGHDITDTPLDFAPGQTIAGVQIVLTDKSTSLSGAVTDSRGRPVTDAAVIVFPADEKRWTYQSRFIRAARPDQDGRYEIRGLPAHDDYLIAAVQGLEDGQAGDPEFLARIKAEASKLALNEGETKAADVKLPAGR
jgi:hypothetical protein